MALIILEGLDRTGKSTIANFFKDKEGYEIIHMSAPQKGTSSDDYLNQMMEIISQAASKNIILDRSHYGELVWPQIFGRKPLLDEDMIDSLIEIENAVETRRVMMHDTDVEAHWQRCVENKEPITKAQFLRAKSLYSSMAHKYNFEVLSLPEFYGQSQADFNRANSPKKEPAPLVKSEPIAAKEQAIVKPTVNVASEIRSKLETANAINEILSKRIIKQKGTLFDQIEKDIHQFLSTKLSELLGTNKQETKISFTEDEINFYKAMYTKAIKKGDK